MKKKIDEQLDSVRVSPALRQRILSEASNTGSSRIKPYTSGILVACTVLLLSVATLASTGLFEKIREVLGNTYETELLNPLPEQEISSAAMAENSGIKMDIAAAMTDGESTVAYMVIQDTVGGRLDNSFQPNHFILSDDCLAYVNGWTYHVVDFNPSTNTLIVKFELDGKDLGGKKIHFTLSSFFSKQKFLESISIVDSIASVRDQTEDAIVMKQPTSEIQDEYALTLPAQKLLPLDKMNQPLDAEGTMQLTNIGLIDNQLHIQTKYRGDIAGQQYSYYQFDSDTEEIQSYYLQNIYYILDENGVPVEVFDEPVGEKRTYYQESIYDLSEMGITPEMYENISITDNITYFESSFTGNWDLTFTVEKIKETIIKECNITLGDFTASSITISPMGITLRGTSPKGEFTPGEAYAMKQGIKVPMESTSSTWTLSETDSQEENAVISYTFNEVMKVEDITSITIGDNIVTLELP